MTPTQSSQKGSDAFSCPFTAVPSIRYISRAVWLAGGPDFPESYSQMPLGLHQLKANQDNSKVVTM